MERHFLRYFTATAYFRTPLGLFLICVFLWGSVCCESFAFGPEIPAEVPAEIHAETQAAGVNDRIPAHKMCHKLSDSTAGDSTAANLMAASSTDTGCDCFHPNKSLAAFTLGDSALSVSLTETYTQLSPWQTSVFYAAALPVLQRQPRPPPGLFGPPVFYPSTVLLI